MPEVLENNCLPLEALSQQLDQVYKLLDAYGLDPQVIVQVYRQVRCVVRNNELLISTSMHVFINHICCKDLGFIDF